MVGSDGFAGGGIHHDVANTQAPHFLAMHRLIALPLRVTRTRQRRMRRILTGKRDARVGHHMQ
ncbi:hypothetical protein D3C73_1665050 [compost metagenome]